MSAFDWAPRRQTTQALAVAAALVASLCLLVTVALLPELSRMPVADGSALTARVFEITILVLIAAGAWLVIRRARLTWAFAMAGIAIAAGPVAEARIVDGAVVVALLAGMPVASLACGALASSMPARARLGRHFVGVIGAALVWPLLAIDPAREPGCVRVCRSVPTPLSDVLAGPAAYGVWAAFVVTGAGIAGLLAWHARRILRRSLVVGGIICALVIGTAGVARLLAWGESLPVLILRLVPVLALGPLVVALFIFGAQDAAARRAVSRIAGALARGGDEQLAGRVQFANPQGGWVDIWGEPMSEQTDWGLMEGPRGRVARVAGAGGSALTSAPDATRLLVLENGRLLALTRARARELRAAQRQIVTVSDAEARRLERDLHDGGQQRLVSALMFLGAASADLDGEAQHSPNAAELAAAQAEIREGLGQLRTVSHGYTPDTIRTDGIWTALHEAAREQQVKCVIDDRGLPAIPSDSAAAALYVVGTTALAIGSRHSSTVGIAARCDSSTLRVRITVGGVQLEMADFVDAADRVGALAGSVQIVSDGALEVLLPCES